DVRPETPTYVPYHFLFGPRTREFPRRADLAEVDLSQIKPETRAGVAEILADNLHRPLSADEQKPGSGLDQLGLDSIQRQGVMLAIEERFGFAADQVPLTVGQLWALAQGLVESAPVQPPPADWFRELPDGPPVIEGDTIAQAFVNRALANRTQGAVADDLAGVVTYERLLTGALLLARRFAKLSAPNVGLMLPSSAACDLALLGLYLANKLPVLLNWTTGPGNLAHAARTMALGQVITSRAFVDRTGIVVGGTEYLFVEDLRKDMGKLEKLWTLL